MLVQLRRVEKVVLGIPIDLRDFPKTSQRLVKSRQEKLQKPEYVWPHLDSNTWRMIEEEMENRSGENLQKGNTYQNIGF